MPHVGFDLGTMVVDQVNVSDVLSRYQQRHPTQSAAQVQDEVAFLFGFADFVAMCEAARS